MTSCRLIVLCTQVEALVREVFDLTGHCLPDPAAMKHKLLVSGMTLTAVFAPGVSADGGGEDVAKALQATMVDAGAEWVVSGATAKYTIIILTGALLKCPGLANQVCPCNFRSSPARSSTCHITICADKDCVDSQTVLVLVL